MRAWQFTLRGFTWCFPARRSSSATADMAAAVVPITSAPAEAWLTVHTGRQLDALRRRAGSRCWSSGRPQYLASVSESPTCWLGWMGGVHQGGEGSAEVFKGGWTASADDTAVNQISGASPGLLGCHFLCGP